MKSQTIIKTIKKIFTTCLLCIVANNAVYASFKLPKYETYTLKNGLQVYLMQQSEVPMIDMSLVIKAGSINDGKTYGLANLTGEAVQFGTATMSKADVEDAMAFVGAELSSITSKEMTRLSLSFAKRDIEQLLPIFSALALTPSFDKSEFNKFKSRFLSLLTQRKESPRGVISDAFNRLYFGQHPYGNPLSGDEESVSKLKLDDVKGFYKNFYTPKNSALVIVGDFNKTTIKTTVNKYFGLWKGEQPKSDLVPFISAPQQSNVLLINKEDAIETTFYIGGKGISANHPDAVAVQVINTILGGRFTSWLNDELRVNSGLTYGARSRFNSYQYAGSFTISTFTKKATTFEAIDLAKKTYQRLWEKGIDKETLDSAKAYVKGQFPPRYETSTQLSRLLARMWALDLDNSFINDFETNVDSMDVAKANEVARRVFPAKNLQYVLVGKASDIRDKAKSYGQLKEVDIKDLSF